MSASTHRRLMGTLGVILTTLGLAITVMAATQPVDSAQRPWTREERAMLRSLSLRSLPALPADPSNRHADDDAAARLGAQLFFDTRLSSNGKVSCGTCHDPAKAFQDGIPLGRGVGTAGRRTMPIAGTAYSPWQFWDGRADSQWGQALGPLESAVEHGGDRVQYAWLMRSAYRQEYEAVFGPLPALAGLPDRAGPVADPVRSAAWARIPSTRQDEVSGVYANIGKAIAAFERRITPMPSRFDRFVDAELAGQPVSATDAFTSDERAGLRLFIGRANCSNCHNGPLLTDNHFHNTGVPVAADGALNDQGRTTGVATAMTSEFNCLGRHSDAKPADCAELRFAVTEGAELVRAYKTPSLRNATTRPPYMHAGQLPSMAAVLAHYNRAPAAPAGTTELQPLRLSRVELRQLEAFLATLVSPVEFPRPVAPSPRHQAGADSTSN